MRQNYFKEVCFYYLFRSALLNGQISECTEDVDKIDRLSPYLPPLLLLERNTHRPPCTVPNHIKVHIIQSMYKYAVSLLNCLARALEDSLITLSQEIESI